MNKPHTHAALMLQYAQDAAETETPWERSEMSTKTKGDILAELIDLNKMQKNKIGLRICNTRCGITALVIDRKFPCEMCYVGIIGTRPVSWDAEGRIYPECDPHPWDIVMPKPWTLGRSVNGFTLGDGQEWHRHDWTEDMLPEGFRPLIKGEQVEAGDQRLHIELGVQTFPIKTEYGRMAEYVIAGPEHMHLRTRRQVIDPYAELKAAFKAGKTIQMRGTNPDADDWTDMPNPEFRARAERYRIKPAPKLVPLGPEDVPPGSAVRYLNHSTEYGNKWLLVTCVSMHGVNVSAGQQNGSISFTDLMKLEISRDNGKTWQRCEKEAK